MRLIQSRKLIIDYIINFQINHNFNYHIIIIYIFNHQLFNYIINNKYYLINYQLYLF